MTIRTDTSPTQNTLLLSVLGGAAIGAIVMALITPKTGREVRHTLRIAARKLSGRADEPEEFDTGTIDALFI